MKTRSDSATNKHPSESARRDEVAAHTPTTAHGLLSESLSAIQLLDLWEQGAKLPPYAQALLLLSAAFPTLTQDELADWSLGQRDAALLELHALLFGASIEALAACPHCAAQTSLHFQATDLRTAYAPSELPALETSFESHNFVLRLRPVTSAMIAAVTDGRRERLLLECILAAERDGVVLMPADLPPEVLARCEAIVAEADPQADIRLALHCLECGQQWNAVFDPLSFLWREIEHWAERMLREVHVLASAYGWDEARILGLSAARRRRYLEMVIA